MAASHSSNTNGVHGPVISRSRPLKEPTREVYFFNSGFPYREIGVDHVYCARAILRVVFVD